MLAAGAGRRFVCSRDGASYLFCFGEGWGKGVEGEGSSILS